MPVDKIEWSVILLKAPKYNDKTWFHSDYASAATRAWALQDLHSCKAETDRENRTITVDATDYYNKPSWAERQKEKNDANYQRKTY